VLCSGVDQLCSFVQQASVNNYASIVISAVFLSMHTAKPHERQLTCMNWISDAWQHDGMPLLMGYGGHLQML
jgi:hypothetical protein